jgi:hypothetical protein
LPTGRAAARRHFPGAGLRPAYPPGLTEGDNLHDHSQRDRKLMKLTTTDNGSLRLGFRVQVNPAELVTMHGQAVGKSDTHGRVPAHEHFALQMTELRKAELRRP